MSHHHRRPVSPAQSTTSLSDDEDEVDYVDKSTFFEQESCLVPAVWRRPGPIILDGHSPVSTLPPELLIHILKHMHTPRDLYSAMRVSKRWCSCSVELLWHKPAFPRTNTLVKMMRVLSLDNQTFTYARFIRRLNFLYLGGDLTNSLFQRLNQCDRLERLTLVNCGGISDDALVTVLPCCPNLVAIDLTGVLETSDKAIVGLASAAKRLQGINLGGCSKVTDVGIMALAVNCPLLRRVKLSGVEEITNAPVSALAKYCLSLLEIDLNNCKNITDQAVRDIWVYSHHMRELRLSQCVELTDAAFPSPVRSEANTPAGVSNPFPTSRHAFEELPPLILNRTCEQLRMLDLTACALITDDAVEGIISHSPKIRNIVFSKCVQLTDRSVEAICTLGRHIHYLHLGHAAQITDRSVTLLAQACTRLRYVDFANCVLLTDMSVSVLATLPKLRRIGLVRVNNMTDAAINALADHHTTLERIHLSYCDQISVQAIHYLLMRLKKLTHLSLTGIPSFRREELQQFCRLPPTEFNTAQRLAFCVFSGKGVNDLRDYLDDHFVRQGLGHRTEDSEDDDDDEGYEAEPEEPLTPAPFRQNTDHHSIHPQDTGVGHPDDTSRRGRPRYPGEPSYLAFSRDRASPPEETLSSHPLAGRFSVGVVAPGPVHPHARFPATQHYQESSTPPSHSEMFTPELRPSALTATALFRALDRNRARGEAVAVRAANEYLMSWQLTHNGGIGIGSGQRSSWPPPSRHVESAFDEEEDQAAGDSEAVLARRHARANGRQGEASSSSSNSRPVGAPSSSRHAEGSSSRHAESSSSRHVEGSSSSRREAAARHAEAAVGRRAEVASPSAAPTGSSSSASSSARRPTEESGNANANTNLGSPTRRNVKTSLRNTFTAAGSFFRHGGTDGGNGGGEGSSGSSRTER